MLPHGFLFLYPVGVTALEKSRAYHFGYFGRKETGFSISIHGQGYFYPLEKGEIWETIRSNEKLKRLPKKIKEIFGGRFLIPNGHEEFYNAMVVKQFRGGWAWLACQSD